MISLHYRRSSEIKFKGCTVGGSTRPTYLCERSAEREEVDDDVDGNAGERGADDEPADDEGPVGVGVVTVLGWR